MKRNIIVAAIAAVGIFASCTVIKPYAVTNNPIGTKVGKSTNTCLFSAIRTSVKYHSNLSAAGLCFNNNKYSIQEAAKSAGIKKVGAVDLQIQDNFFVKKFTLVVYGE